MAWLTASAAAGRGCFPAAVVAELKAMACEPPEDRDVPQSRWSAADLAAQAAAEGLVESVARSTVARWLDADAIRPWRYRSWIFPRDPQFEVKAGRVLDLYQGHSSGVPDAQLTEPPGTRAPAGDVGPGVTGVMAVKAIVQRAAGRGTRT
jgi:hypothetical protein